MPFAPQNDRVVVLVDAFGINAHVAPALLGYGIRSVHVSSGNENVGVLRSSHSSECYLADISYAGDIDSLVAQLSPYRVFHVWLGLESGVELAGELAARLRIPTRNDDGLIKARRHKAAMLDALADAGIPVRKHREVTAADQASAWSLELDSWPVVVKPTNSGGTDRVRICADVDDVERAVANVLGQRNIFGTFIESALVEEFLPGQEYMVNTVSTDGWHRIIEIWRTAKRQQFNAQVYDYFELVDPESDEGRRVIEPIDGILDALGIRWGPGHLELMDTPHGVQLVELAGRCHAGDLSAPAAARGTNHVIETAHSVLSPKTYRMTTKAVADTGIACCSVVMLNHRDGVLARQPDWDRLRELKTFHSMRVRWSQGQQVAATRDIFTSAGNVYLVGDPDDVAADRELVRAWAQDDMTSCIDNRSEEGAFIASSHG